MPLISMRQLLLSLSVVALLGACGGGDAPPPSVDGTWSAESQVVGSSLTLRLISQNATVTGAGTYSIAGGSSGVLAVAGTYQPPAAILSFAYDNGDTAVYTAVVSDANHMNGRLTYKNGTSSDLTLVRQ